MTSPLRLFLEAPRRVEAARVVVRGTLRTREAVRIALRDSGGGVGHGEALPLPGYSADTALQAELALAAAAARARTVGGLALPDDGLAPAAYLNAALVPFDTLLTTTPSARFALECALLGLLAGRAGVSAAQWLAGRRALHQVAVSVLLPDDDSAVAAAGAAAARGHTVLKLKIALPGRSAADEEARIAAVRAAADAASRPGAVRLRLDANGALPPPKSRRGSPRWRASASSWSRSPAPPPPCVRCRCRGRRTNRWPTRRSPPPCWRGRPAAARRRWC